jgi:DNA-binding transcriptional LysR family regulator
VLTIASTRWRTEELLSEILAHFSRSYPGARLEVTVGNSQELSEALESGGLDLALFAGTPSKATPLFRREQLLWIAGALCTPPPTARRLDLVEITVKVDFEQRRRMIARPAGRLRLDIEAQLREVEPRR